MNDVFFNTGAGNPMAQLCIGLIIGIVAFQVLMAIVRSGK